MSIHFEELPPDVQAKLTARSPELRQIFAEEEERETVAELKKEIERLKRQNERRIKPAASQKIIIRDKPNSPAKNNDLTFLIALLVGVGAVVAQVLTFLFCF